MLHTQDSVEMDYMMNYCCRESSVALINIKDLCCPHGDHVLVPRMHSLSLSFPFLYFCSYLHDKEASAPQGLLCSHHCSLSPVVTLSLLESW